MHSNISNNNNVYTAAMVTKSMCSMKWSVRKVLMSYSTASRTLLWRKLIALIPIQEWMSKNTDTIVNTIVIICCMYALKPFFADPLES